MKRTFRQKLALSASDADNSCAYISVCSLFTAYADEPQAQLIYTAKIGNTYYTSLKSSR